jgi:hypothetical protein
MSNVTYFVQGCPTCGRRLQIRVEYLGKRVICQHCHGKFMAVDPAGARADFVDQGSALMKRADELLESVALKRAQMRSSIHD